MEFCFQAMKLQPLHRVKYPTFIDGMIGQIGTHTHRALKWNARCVGGSGGPSEAQAFVQSNVQYHSQLLATYYRPAIKKPGAIS